jgi:ubiquinone/menaquinone biosynthesis C-methylase UbiE
MSVIDDKETERRRYDDRAFSLGQRRSHLAGGARGSEAVPLWLREPYSAYERLIGENCGPGSTVLELGAGTGEFSEAALLAGAHLVATDISSKSLSLAAERYVWAGERFAALAADMERIPFDGGRFDMVTRAGSLSYWDNFALLRGVHRVLRPGGVFVCVDSLNHNPIYRLNRWVHFRRGRRTRSTLERMPTLRLIEEYRKTFGEVEVRFFGGAAWVMPFAARLFGNEFTAELSARIDRFFRVRQSAFKFVMLARKGRFQS